ncbi:hypothetical protein AB6A23_20130 [Paenibacillus tarimensis]
MRFTLRRSSRTGDADSDAVPIPDPCSRHPLQQRQGDAIGSALKSFFLHCRDVNNMDMKVIYKASNPMFEGQYAELTAKTAGFSQDRTWIFKISMGRCGT